MTQSKQTSDDLKAWEDFKKSRQLRSIDIPYTFSAWGCVVSGIVHVTDNADDTWTEGIVTGAVLATYRADRNSGAVDLYDPTGQLLKLVVFIDVAGREIRFRFDNRNWDGSWNEGDWAVMVRW